MRFAPCFAVALAAALAGGALLDAPALAANRPVIEASATTAPVAPTVPTTLPLPTQSTSLTPVSAPPTTATAINDAKATQLVNRVVAALVGLAVLIALLTIWYWRSTKPVPPSLEGVELMSTRKWLRGKPDKRARLLSEYHAKRGPVPEESIARVGAQTVRVGAAVAAPAAAPAMAPVSVMAPAGERGPAPESVDLRELTDEPPILVLGDADEEEAPAAPSSPPAPAVAAPNGDGETAFTVVARRPRAEGDTGRSPEAP
jgi:hypothetical protein